MKIWFWGFKEKRDYNLSQIEQKCWGHVRKCWSEYIVNRPCLVWYPTICRTFAWTRCLAYLLVNWIVACRRPRSIDRSNMSSPWICSGRSDLRRENTYDKYYSHIVHPNCNWGDEKAIGDNNVPRRRGKSWNSIQCSQALILNHFRKHQLSKICTELFLAFCLLEENPWRYGNMKMLGGVLNKSNHVFRKTSQEQHVYRTTA